MGGRYTRTVLNAKELVISKASKQRTSDLRQAGTLTTVRLIEILARQHTPPPLRLPRSALKILYGRFVRISVSDILSVSHVSVIKSKSGS